MNCLNRRCLLVGGLLPILILGCASRRVAPLETRLRCLQQGDRWLYHRSGRLHASDVTVLVTELHVLGNGVRELTLRLSWQENIEKRVPNVYKRDGYSYAIVGQRPAWQLQKIRQNQDGTLLWGGVGGTSESVSESGTTHLDDPNTGIIPLFLSLDSLLLTGSSQERTVPVTSSHVGVETVQLSHKMVGVESVETKLGMLAAMHISGTQTQEMRGGKTWKIYFDDWYDGHRLLLKRTFKIDDGSAVLGTKQMWGGTWLLKEFQTGQQK